MMTWRIPLFCVLALAGSLTALGAQDRTVQSDSQTLVQLERDWDAAFLRRDVRFIETILAEDFFGTSADGSRADKAKELSLAAGFNQRIESSVLDDFFVRVIGDTAVVCFTRHVVGISQGQRLELAERFLDVFVWRDGRWQCLASQSTRVTAA